ncbi:MAG: helix-turn-helix transcriptional regulator [Oscillatoriales cyanobacterium RM2_1_1]|nr:helix-turn-helix transcriptional regulator [Oscillatoriales cyanobacterium RM2_1_1]
MPIPNWVAAVKWSRALGERVRTLREEKGLSRSGLSNQIAKLGSSVAPTTIQRLEIGWKPNDDTQFPKSIETETLRAIAMALGMTEDDWIEILDQTEAGGEG